MAEKRTHSVKYVRKFCENALISLNECLDTTFDPFISANERVDAGSADIFTQMSHITPSAKQARRLSVT